MSKPQTQSEGQQVNRSPTDAGNPDWQAENNRTQWYFAVGLIFLWALVYVAVKSNLIHPL